VSTPFPFSFFPSPFDAFGFPERREAEKRPTFSSFFFFLLFLSPSLRSPRFPEVVIERVVEVQVHASFSFSPPFLLFPSDDMTPRLVDERGGRLGPGFSLLSSLLPSSEGVLMNVSSTGGGARHSRYSFSLCRGRAIVFRST